ncbi:MAG TPA: hypothetical protein VHQ24_14400 [Lachnospiraceae bacterium]|nr:hypothetical protein [Lachnospiraceae bacterium]
MCDQTDKPVKREVPVLSYEELLKKERGELKITGPFKIRKEDSEKALEYFNKR